MRIIRLYKNNNQKNAFLLLDKKKFFCKVGANGVGKKLREGDLVTPKGVFYFQKVFFRSDRLEKPRTTLQSNATEKFYYWCTDPSSKNYNKLLKKNKKVRCENLYRKDNLYDIVVQISFNTFPIIKNKGSAIFMHCLEANTQHTDGCIALEKKDLFHVLKYVNKSTKLVI